MHNYLKNIFFERIYDVRLVWDNLEYNLHLSLKYMESNF